MHHRWVRIDCRVAEVARSFGICGPGIILVPGLRSAMPGLPIRTARLVYALLGWQIPVE
jgi:hypothetical protein